MSGDTDHRHEVRRPQGPALPLILASPHSGRGLPKDFRPAPGIRALSLRSAEDAYVDDLIQDGADHGASLIRAGVSRAYVDLNRAPDELDPELVEGIAPKMASAKARHGFGVVPRLTGDGQVLQEGRLTKAAVQARLARYHRPYHEALSTLMLEARAAHRRAVLIDCHSMPSTPFRGRARGATATDVVLGDRHGTSCSSSLTRRVRTLFEAKGWRVALNHPYAGGYTTQLWGRPTEGFEALQIEISRGLYLDERTLEPGPGYTACRKVLAGVLAALCQDLKA